MKGRVVFLASALFACQDLSASDASHEELDEPVPSPEFEHQSDEAQLAKMGESQIEDEIDGGWPHSLVRREDREPEGGTDDQLTSKDGWSDSDESLRRWAEDALRDKATSPHPVTFDLTPDVYRVDWNTGRPDYVPTKGPELPRLNFERPSLLPRVKTILEWKAMKSGCHERTPANAWRYVSTENSLPPKEFRECVLRAGEAEQVLVRYLFFIEDNVVRALGQMESDFDPTQLWEPLERPIVGPLGKRPERAEPNLTQEEMDKRMELLREHNHKRGGSK